MKIEISTKSVIFAIATGFVACILWEICQPLFQKIFHLILSFTEVVTQSYSDKIYSEISLGFHESTSVSLFNSALFCLGLVALSLYRKILKTLTQKLNCLDETHIAEHCVPIKEKSENTLTAERHRLIKKRRLFLLIFIFCIFLFIGMIYNMWESYYINQTQANTLANIEIVSPYISNSEYQQLKADFYSIDSKSDYDSLCSTLLDIAETNSANLKN